MNQRWRFIHLSDFHFCAEPVRHNALSLIKRLPRDLIDTGRKSRPGLLTIAKPASYLPDITSGVAKFCLDHSTVTDGIFITGDLSTTGMMLDIRVAYSFVTEPASNGFVTDARSPTIHSSGLPMLIVPGNHDKFTDNRASPACKNFELKFEAYMRNFRDGVSHWVRRKGDRHFGIIGADFCLQERGDALDKVAGPFGQGRVYNDVLQELKNRTFYLRDRYKKIFLIWIIHFAPFECGYGLRLIDFDDITGGAAALGVEATLCGHTHKASKHQINGHTIYCSGSAGCVDSEDDSRVHIMNFDLDNGNIFRENFVWSDVDHEFVMDGVD